MPTDENLDRIIAGRYRVRRVLGAGAHGRVYLAEDLGRGGGHVALKLVEDLVGGAPQDAADDILRRFRHPHWAAVLDQGVRGEHAWFQVVEYVRGRSLDMLEGPQPIEHVWRLLEDGARVLGALHRIGLIHYDVTPGNVMLTDDGGELHFVLTDGGLAHLGPVRGVARGTPQYMAPEVTEEGGHDHRSDLYALGLVAYRLATGRDPVQGGAGEVLGKRRREDAPRASTFRPELPAALDDLLGALLARDPNARPHDALTLLERLDVERPDTVPPFLHAEGVAAAESGSLVGRSDLIERFDASLGVVAQRIAAGGGRLARARAPVLSDPVMIVRGAPGSGCTRTADECFNRARDANVPAVLMSGRETTGDRRGPLRHLVDGMAALRLERGDEYREIRLDLGTRRGLGREERAHALTRAVEAFVRGVETTAQRTPFVLVVEDFPDLPQRAREAVRVLARHLLARRESGGATTAPPVLLLVDVGHEEPDSLLVPDTSEPERPIATLGPLDAEQAGAICAERFPGLQPVRADLERIAEACEGLPGALVALMAEGCRRGDLCYESGRWSWNVDGLDDYDIERGLSPVHADALRAASGAVLRLLAYLSLVEAPLAESVVAALWSRHTTEAVPSSVLIRTLARDGETHFTTTNLAVRKAVLARLRTPERDERAKELLTALDEQDHPETALDRAALALSVGTAADAVGHLVRAWPQLAYAARVRAQRQLLAALSTRDTASASVLKSVAHMLEPGPDGLELAERVGVLLLDQEPDLESLHLVCSALEHGRSPRAALALLQRAKFDEHPSDELRARLHTLRSWLLFDTHQVGQATEAARAARRSLRKTARSRADGSGLRCRLLMAEAQAAFMRGASSRAAWLLTGASLCAKGTGRTAIRAQVLNNLGIVRQQMGQHEESRRCFARALRLRRLLGDVDGAAKCTINLGRIEQHSGSLVKSASLFQSAAATAQRYAQSMTLARSLRFLAQVYDQQLNTRLAITTLQRVVLVGEQADLPTEAARAAWDLAPLAAACGEQAFSAEALERSARAAHARVTSYSRPAHHLAAAISAMHLGARRRVQLCLRRARRHEGEMYPELQQVLQCMEGVSAYYEAGSTKRLLAEAPRPERASPLRHLWRAWLWLERAMRRDAGSAAQFPLAISAGGRSGHMAAMGRDRRLLVEMALLAMRSPGSAESLPANVERHLLHTGEAQLLSRLLAVRSLVEDSGPAAAQMYSRSVQLDSTQGPRRQRCHASLAHEHAVALQRHAEGVGAAVGLLPGTREQHALAHRLLVHHGCTTAPDGRVASALRRVLAATGRMNAGAGLDDLLEAMTRDTIEITGAERTCVVLVDANTQLEMRVATSATAKEVDVDVEDLSQTVIQRVIESRTPLLMHDVFDDEELMGRPSITSLSLRSILCVPMLRGDTLYGVLYADSASAAGSFDSVDQEVLSLFAEQAAAALETHRLVADVQNSMSELKAMQERLVKGERLRTMGELSSGVAHEFNNLLTSILARVQLINLNNLGRELKGDLDLIEKACLDAAEVVRRLQSYTRRQRQEHFERVDLAEICRDAVEFLRPLWSTRRRHGRAPIHVKLRVEDGLHVEGNPTELREVVTNLLKNALDALTEGGDIAITARHREGLVQVQVEDDGPGIPEEIRTRIFDPFFTTKGERGTGLGLCLSQQIIDRHGGEMVLDAHPGSGTRFTIVLPTADALADVNGQNEETLEGREPALRILVVDDDENVRMPLCRFLERSGYEVVSAKDGEEGESVAREQHPDVVITDVAMPRVDGLELCRRLKRERSEVPIVLMSGWTSGVDPARARLAGATALLAKPFALQQVTDLLGTIAEAARRRS